MSAANAVDEREIMVGTATLRASRPLTDTCKEGSMDSDSTPERKWRMTRLAKGDYLLPSNDRQRLWRIQQYREDGTLEGEDGVRVYGRFWRVPLCQRPATSLTLSDIEYTDWDVWHEMDSLLPTREIAIKSAMGYDAARVGEQPNR